MSVKRQQNWLGSQRVDIPHLRALDSSVAADFDLLAGRVLAGQTALVVRGFDVNMTSAGVGSLATSLQVNVASGVLLHPLAAEAGTIFDVADDTAAETLSASNGNLEGSFTAGAVNYLGVDLRRAADATTADRVMFIDADTEAETPQTVPLARTLSYKLIVSAVDFASTPTVCPIAKITTDANNVVTAVVDARQMYFRLGSGGGSPDTGNVFPWPQDRVETATGTDTFRGADKAITSEKAWKDAVMSRLWELGGGEAWYRGTSDRDVKLAYTSDVLAGGQNVEWTLASDTLEWKGLEFVFANSTGWNNAITDGTAVIEDGECLYVDIDRTATGTVLVAAVATLTALGEPDVPGSRFVIAWRRGDDVFMRDYPFEIGRAFDLPAALGDDQNVLFEGGAGVGIAGWARIKDDDVLPILSITTFAAVTPAVEKGTAVVSPSFTATYAEGPPTDADLTDSDASPTKDVSGTPTAFTSNVTFTKTTAGSNPQVVFTLTADDGDTPDVATATIAWQRYHYAGVGTTAAPTINEAFVLALPATGGSPVSGSKALTTGVERRIQMLSTAAPSNEYVWIAYPKYHGLITSIADNLTGTVITSSFTLQVTEPSVSVEVVPSTIAELYYVYRSNYLQNGPVDLTVS